MEKKGRRFSDEHEDIVEDIAPEVEQMTSDDEASSKKKKSNKKHSKDERLKKKNSKKLEKMMKKKHRKKKSPDPESEYDEEADIPLQEDHPHKSRFTKKQIIFAVVIVLVLFVVVFYASNADKLSFHNISNFINYGVLNRSSEESFPLDIQGESIRAGNFVRKGQDICYCSDTKTQVLNNYGRSVWSVQHAFINPVLTTSENKVMVYNLGGTGFQIIDTNGDVYSADAPDNILVAAINRDGVYALVTQNSGYHSKLYVYNEENEQIFAYSFADYYVTSVSLSESGKRAVVSGVSALDGVDIASLYVLDFTKDTPLYFSELEGNIIYDVCYMSDKYACAIGRSGSYVINTYNGAFESFSYDGRDLTAYDINTETDTYTISLSASGDGRNCEIISFGSTGKQDRSFTVDEKIIGLSTYKGRVSLLTNDSVMLYAKDGGHYNDEALRSDPHSVVMYTSSDAYVLCTGYIEAITL